MRRVLAQVLFASLCEPEGLSAPQQIDIITGRSWCQVRPRRMPGSGVLSSRLQRFRLFRMAGLKQVEGLFRCFLSSCPWFRGLTNLLQLRLTPSLNPVTYSVTSKLSSQSLLCRESKKVGLCCRHAARRYRVLPDFSCEVSS